MREFLLTLLLIAVVARDPGAQPAPDAFLGQLNLREGGTACEIGAGDGELTRAAARLVGTGGRVYSSELGEARVRTLREKIGSEFSQVTVVAGEATGTNFPDAGCDAVFMRDVYHHFSEPGAMNAAIGKALKSGGRLGLVDFTPPPGSHAPTPADRGTDGMHGISPEAMTQELKDAGFQPVASEMGKRWFMLVFEKSGQ